MSLPRRPLTKLISGHAHPVLAEAVAHELDIPLVAAEIAPFADGELRIHVHEDVRTADVFLIQPTCPPTNENLMVLVLLADAVRAAGAAHVTAAVPYFGYARQDQRSRPGDPRSAQVVGRLLASAGIDHLVTLDLHSPALESAFSMPVTMLHADELFLPQVKNWHVDGLVVVSPDAGGMKRAQRYAQALGAPLAVVAKQRLRADVATPLQVLGDVRDRVCLVVDDMASTGRTLSGAADALRHAGAIEIRGIFTHAVMAPGAEERLANAGFAKLLTSDSIPVPPARWLEIVPIASFLANALSCLIDAK
jgi:ribose-phosphate pyrophosphokinase